MARNKSISTVMRLWPMATLKAAILSGDTSEAVVDLLLLVATLLYLGIETASVNLPAVTIQVYEGAMIKYNHKLNRITISITNDNQVNYNRTNSVFA